MVEAFLLNAIAVFGPDWVWFWGPDLYGPAAVFSLAAVAVGISVMAWASSL